MAKRSIEYARITEAEAIQVFTSNPRGWAMPETNHEADALFRERADELDLEVYVVFTQAWKRNWSTRCRSPHWLCCK